MEKKKLLGTLFIAACLATTTLVAVSCSKSGDDNPAPEELLFDKDNNLIVPDANFKAYLLANEEINTNKDKNISKQEAESFAGRIICSKKNITSLQGIQAFVNLTKLYCYDNQLATLDVSKNTELTHLICAKNQLKILDVSKNVNLTELGCSNNQFEILDVSKNTELTYLYCDNNLFEILDVSKNVNLTIFGCSNNQLKILDVSKNVNLTELGCSNNQFEILDVSKNTELTYLYCKFNKKLKKLNIKNGNIDKLETLNATECDKLTCILVDDVAKAQAKPNDKWEVSSTDLYKTNCN